MVTLLALLTQTPVPAPSFDYITPILNVGMVGVLLLLLATETLFITVKSHKREVTAKNDEITRLREDNAELKGALREATDTYVTDVLPTLTRALDAERELVDLRRDEASERRRRGPKP